MGFSVNSLDFYFPQCFYSDERAMKFIQLERLYHEQLLANLSAIQEQWGKYRLTWNLGNQQECNNSLSREWAYCPDFACGKNWSYTVKLLLQSTGRGCSSGWEPAQRVQAVSSPSTRREGRQGLFSLCLAPRSCFHFFCMRSWLILFIEWSLHVLWSHHLALSNCVNFWVAWEGSCMFNYYRRA